MGRALGQAAPGAAFLAEHAAAEIGARLDLVSRSFERGLALGGVVPALAEALRESGRVASVIRLEEFADAPGLEDGPALVADAEALSLADGAFDLVAATGLEQVNDLPGALIQIRRALVPDGLFLGIMLGGSTLRELREAFVVAEEETLGGASPRVLPFTDVRDVGALLQRAGFALPVTDRDALTVRYGSAFELFSELKRMGATNALHARSRHPASRRLLLRAAEVYAERFADADGRIRATFEFVSMSGWAPHPSQQKPLAPGSARVSLAEALNDRSGTFADPPVRDRRLP